MFSSLLKKFLLSHLVITAVILSQNYIAVMEFAGKNVSSIEASALTDRLRSELFRTGQFRVIEREMMNDILTEQGFQMSGCTTDECIVEMGRLIGVDQIISGSVSRVGDVYSIAARMVSVETAEIVKIATYDHEGKIGELLKTGMATIAAELAIDKTAVAAPAVSIPKQQPIVEEKPVPSVDRRPDPIAKKTVTRTTGTTFGVIGGFGLSIPQYLDETYYDYYVGGSVMFGGYVNMSLGSFTIRPEILYTERGHSWEPSNGDLEFVTKIKGLSINTLYPWRIGNLNILFGLSSNFILSGTVLDVDTEDEYEIGEDRDFWMADNLQAIEISTIFGVEYMLDQFLLGLRWSVDLNTVYTESWDRAVDMNYSRGLFTVGYQF